MLRALVFLSGLAALSWQVVWQLKSSLALGVSAFGTALTLAVTMAGLCLGSLWAGAWLRNRAVRPLRVYAALEMLIGLCGLVLAPAFVIIERLDSAAYAVSPVYAPVLHVFSIAVVLGVPTLAMGATLPVFGLMARSAGLPLSRLYGLNTLGAAIGALVAAFVFIPLFGVNTTIMYIAGINVLVALLLCLPQQEPVAPEVQPQAVVLPSRQLLAVAAVTGFATFVLEVAWFRSLTAAFGSTTDAFAVMLASVLLALGLGARLVPWLRRTALRPAQVLAAAGLAALLATPIIERFDLITSQIYSDFPLLVVGVTFLMSLFFLGLPMLLLGMVLPWLLDSQSGPRDWSRLYALNSFSGVVGSLLAGWVLLPHIGFVAAAWLAGGLLVLTGVVLLSSTQRTAFAGIGVAAFVAVVLLHSGAGSSRTQLNFVSSRLQEGRVLASYNGPDVTTSAVEYANGIRALIIDGTLATAQPGIADKLDPSHYMPWMGHLPMLMHENPQTALVICFGTGQTANAVRQENPQRVDIVDINPHVFDLAKFFTANQGVLNDERIHRIIMDGRAWLRRTDRVYDVITLEPMPPTHAGVNALYSAEFYRLTKARLSESGLIAQWLPFHLLTPYHAASVAATFRAVFPNSILWIDPLSTTGILLGSVNEATELGKVMPGYTRAGIARDMSEEDVRKAIVLDRARMARFASFGEEITDDNQLLSYGGAVHPARRSDPADSHDLAVSIRLMQ